MVERTRGTTTTTTKIASSKKLTNVQQEMTVSTSATRPTESAGAAAPNGVAKKSSKKVVPSVNLIDTNQVDQAAFAPVGTMYPYEITRRSGVTMTISRSLIWGGQVRPDKINFEWPTKAMMESWNS